MESVIMILLDKYTNTMFCLLHVSFLFTQQAFVKHLTTSQGIQNKDIINSNSEQCHLIAYILNWLLGLL